MFCVYVTVTDPPVHLVHLVQMKKERESPKLSATAVATMNGEDFTARLDRCIERSGKKPLPLPAPVIEARPAEIPAEKLKGPMPHYRNNFRRY